MASFLLDSYRLNRRWLARAVVMLLVVLLLWFVSQAMENLQEEVEKTQVELNVRQMRTGLQWAMGEALLQGKTAEIASWAGSNPMRWLDFPPAEYRGECAAGLASVKGIWCFDSARRELVYRVQHGRHLRQMDGGALQELRWCVSAPTGNIKNQENGGFIGLSVALVTAYLWPLE